jgi:hypothetical protein
MIAGFQYHHGMHPKVFLTLAPGDRLVAVRESANPYDYWAVALYTEEGARLGYLPRGPNRPIAALADQGWPISAAVLSIDPEAEPWRRVRVTIWTGLPGVFAFSAN